MMNNADMYATFNLRLGPQLSLRSKPHGLRLASAEDLWYAGGGAFQPSTFGYQGRLSGGSQDLATVWDLSGNHQVTRFVTATVYFAHASGKRVIAAIYPHDSDGRFAYVEATIHF
jgi:hypothetical protein